MNSHHIDHTTVQRFIVAALGTLFFAVLLTSCATRHAQCSAYGEAEAVEAAPAPDQN
jgi:hypothetical protein